MSTETLRPDDCFHPETKSEGDAVAFYWIEGSPTLPRYKVAILGRTKKGVSRSVTFEYSNPGGVKRLATDAGWELPPIEEIGTLCESAESSRHTTRHRDFVKYADTVEVR